MLGHDFHRQKPIGEYIVDFCCPEFDLIIEIDGSSHDDATVIKRDTNRQRELEELGFRFIRFHDLDVKKNMVQVLLTIENCIKELAAK